MMEEQLLPQLRFPEFDLGYKRVELKKIATFNPKSEELPESFIYIDLESVKNGLLSKEERINKSEAPSRAQRLLRKDDIIYQTVRPYQKNNYFFDKNANDYVASTGYAQIRTKQVSKYLYQYLHTEKFVNKVLVRCTGTSYPAINSTDLSKISINIPNITEQQKIASFLTDVDAKITQLTKKKALLEQYKKGLMQKIFSQELRFKDKNDNEFPKWVEKKLGDLLKTIVDNRGKTPPIEKTGIPLIEINSIKNRFVDYRLVSKFVSENVYKEWFRKYLQDGDLLFSTVGKTAICAIYKQDVLSAIAQNLVGLRFEKENFNFMYYLLTENKNNNKFKRIEMGAVQPSVKVSQMINIVFSIPCIEEQTQIANFLSDIDVKLEALNAKIEQSKVFKKGLLQKMFV
ncbi:restriction endonuclease subunit S [Psychroserpens sp. S379A]|uniref:restriction endonuclease subunit S n=1 Tax=Psychroserpens sp. S379A TaxID=3415137 RepID=UPI003C7A2BB0